MAEEKTQDREPTAAAPLIKRFEKAKNNRNQNWWSHMQEAYQYSCPQRETFFDYSPGQKKNVELYDDTAVLGTETFASKLQANLCPPWQKWTQIVLDPGLDDDAADEMIEFDGEEMKVSEALEMTTDIVFGYIHQSNFDTKIYESFLDLAISTGNLTEEYDAENDKLVFNALPAPQVYLEAGPNGSIETHWREHEVELRHLARMWPNAKIEGDLARIAKAQPGRKSRFIEGCIYESAGEYRYVVIDAARKETILDETDESSAFISFRTMVTPGETYGRGRIMVVLPSIKTLNLMGEFELTAGAIAASGVWTGTSDAVFNPYNVEIMPGVIIPVSSNDQRNPTMRALDMNMDFQFTQLKRDELQGVVNRALFANPLGDIDDPTKSATEQLIRKQMDLQESGGFFARLFTELINKVIRRTVYLLRKEGKIPNIEIGGGLYSLKHTSPLAKAMDLEDLDKLDQYLARLNQYDPTGNLAAIGTKMEEIPGFVARKIGLDPSLSRSKIEQEQKANEIAEAALSAEQGENPGEAGAA